MDTRTLDAGLALDALAAEQILEAVIEWHRDPLWEDDPCPYRCDPVATVPGATVSLIGGRWTTRKDGTQFFGYPVPAYSTALPAAWQLVEFVTDPARSWVAGFPPGTRLCYAWEAANLWAYNAQQAAHRICLLALYAVGWIDRETALNYPIDDPTPTEV